MKKDKSSSKKNKIAKIFVSRFIHELLQIYDKENVGRYNRLNFTIIV